MQESELKIGDLVELLPPFDVYDGDERLAVFIRDAAHLKYIKTKNYKIIPDTTKLVEALEFYAQSKHYESAWIEGLVQDWKYIIKDRGEIAKQALESYKGGK